jgi:CrcB protein
VTVLLVLLGGSVGALLRYLTDRFVQSRHGTSLPWGTLTVNVAGCLVAGATAGAVSATDGPEWVLTLVVTGFCGAFTTFSAFGFETFRLIERGCPRAAALNTAANLVIGFAAAAGGWALASVIV